MNIFLWQSYGNITAYECEDKAAMLRLVDKIDDEVSSWGVADEVEELREAVARTDNLKIMQREIASFFKRHSGHESFEAGQFDKVRTL